jgi:DNA-binding MarR family transcriptional regulator
MPATRSFDERFGFLVNEVGRLYGRRFDRLAREHIGLSRAQCRLLAALATHRGSSPLSQADLADRLDLSTMAVATLCRRLEQSGWIRRAAGERDRRVMEVQLRPRAEAGLDAALALGDQLQARALAGLSAAERAQLIALLQRVRANLAGEAGA